MLAVVEQYYILTCIAQSYYVYMVIVKEWSPLCYQTTISCELTGKLTRHLRH